MKSQIFLYSMIMALIFLAGCGSSQITINVQTGAYANGGRPFYILVRNIDQKLYVTESYQDVAAKVFYDTEKTVVKAETLYPGTEKEIEVEMQDKLPMAIYFLFTEPGENWKTFFPQPLPYDISFEIVTNTIKSQEPK